MSKHLELQLVLSSGVLRFTCHRSIDDDERATHRANTNPRALGRIDRTWTVSEALLTAVDQETLMDDWATFRGLLAAAEPSVTGARLVRDPDGAAVVEQLLGPSGYQEFRVEAWGIDEYGEVPAATFRSVIPVTLTISAAQVFADADGVYQFDQRLSYSSESGRELVELTTELRTAEGTNALTVARSLCALDMDVFGGTNYTWHPSCNNDDGLVLEVLDGDYRDGSTRVPTSVRATSRIWQWRDTYGGGGGDPGQKVDSPFLERTTDEKGTETLTITTARASGPGAEAWVRARRPVGALKRARVSVVLTEHSASAEWIQAAAAADGSRSDIKVEVSGGGADEELVPMAAGLPQEQIGPVLPFAVTVQVKLTAYGESVKRRDMLFPKQLPSPFLLVRASSREDAHPELVDQSVTDPTGRKWERSASYVYEHPGPKIDTNLLLPLYDEGKTEGVLT